MKRRICTFLATLCLASASMLCGQNIPKGANYEIVVSGTYDEIGKFSDGLAWVSVYHSDSDSEDAEFGYIDTAGKFVIHLPDQPKRGFSDGLALVCDYSCNKFGYIDQSGKWVIPASFDYAEDFFEGMAVVKIDDKYGYIDKSGKMAIAATFDHADYFSDGLAPVIIDGKCGYIDKSGKMAIAATFDEADNFSDGLAIVGIKDEDGYGDFRYIGGKYGYIDKTGTLVIPAKFPYGVFRFSNGWALVHDGEKDEDVYIDKKGNVVLIPSTLGVTLDEYYNIRGGGFLSAEGLSPFEENGKWGYINRKGEIAIPATFEEASSFSEGLAWVMFNDKYGYINTKGNWVIPAAFIEAHDVSEGMAVVRNENGDCVLLRLKLK